MKKQKRTNSSSLFEELQAKYGERVNRYGNKLRTEKNTDFIKGHTTLGKTQLKR